MKYASAAPALTRRAFLRAGSATASFFSLLPFAAPWNVRAASKARPRGTADHLIFLFLNGGPSQIDTFDVKEGPWTPPDFDIRELRGGLLRWPFGLFPRLAGKLDDLAIVRSHEAWEVEHSRAQYYLQVAHPISPARRAEIPSFGAVIAYEFEPRRKPSDFLPPFVAINFADGRRAGTVGGGCLGARFNPLNLDTRADLAFALDTSEEQTFAARWKLLRELEAESLTPELAGLAPLEQMAAHTGTAHTLMTTPAVRSILHLPEEDRKRYGGTALGDGCILARNLIAADAGTRSVIISHPGWDSHKNIYDRNVPNNHYQVCAELDAAFESLLKDLSGLKTGNGQSVLDRTLIVCVGEFGRTVGDLTVNKGRDHHRFASSALFAGGGVKGGRIIGVTDETGGRVIDSGWSRKRSIYIEDVAATIYSALGIDWGKRITATPSGRPFDYLEPVAGTGLLDLGEIEPLWS
jgi:hypothetical protein